MKVRVDIFKNRMVFSSEDSTRTVTSNFTTERLLIGNFAAAEECLRQGLKEIGVKRFLRFGKPDLTICPREMTEGGLSGIEERAFRELALCGGAKKLQFEV